MYEWAGQTRTIALSKTSTVFTDPEKIDELGCLIFFSADKYPNRLRRLVNDGTITSYLDDLESSVTDAIDRQVQLWKESHKEYLTAVECVTFKLRKSWKFAWFLWQEKLCLSVWFIFDLERLCL